MSIDLNEYLEQIQLNEFFVTPLILLSTYLYKQHLSKAAKHCSSFKSTKKNKCLIMYQMEARRKQLIKLNQALNQCIKDKNVNNCQEMVLKKINKIKIKINKLNNSYKKLSS